MMADSFSGSIGSEPTLEVGVRAEGEVGPDSGGHSGLSTFKGRSHVAFLRFAFEILPTVMKSFSTGEGQFHFGDAPLVKVQL